MMKVLYTRMLSSKSCQTVRLLLLTRDPTLLPQSQGPEKTMADSCLLVGATQPDDTSVIKIDAPRKQL